MTETAAVIRHRDQRERRGEEWHDGIKLVEGRVETEAQGLFIVDGESRDGQTPHEPVCRRTGGPGTEPQLSGRRHRPRCRGESGMNERKRTTTRVISRKRRGEARHCTCI